MRYCDILLHLTDDGRGAEKTAMALSLAKRFDTTITALYTLPFPTQIYYMGEYVPPSLIQQQVDETRALAVTARRDFEAAAKQAGVTASWIESDDDALSALQRHGRHCDLAVLGQPDPDRDPSAMGSTLPGDLALALGRPVLVLPYIGQYTAPGKTVLIAWNDSREAARAVHDALPMLLAATSVIVLCIDGDEQQQRSAASLVQHLSHHGITAKLRHTTAADIGAGEALLSALADNSADLLVMGAYGHSRLREMTLGGVTHTILQSMTVPVLLGN